MTLRGRIVAGAILVASLSVGCTPFGIIRGDHWMGTSTGSGGTCFNYWNNALGLNDEELVVPKPAGRLRIMAVGDSFT